MIIIFFKICLCWLSRQANCLQFSVGTTFLRIPVLQHNIRLNGRPSSVPKNDRGFFHSSCSKYLCTSSPCPSLKALGFSIWVVITISHPFSHLGHDFFLFFIEKDFEPKLGKCETSRIVLSQFSTVIYASEYVIMNKPVSFAPLYFAHLQ